MKIVVIGGSGHIGSYLIPRLVEGGYDVINVSRSLRKPYLQSQHWSHVQQIICDRTDNHRWKRASPTKLRIRISASCTC